MSDEIAKTDRRALGQAMRRLRGQAQLTQRQLGETASVDDTYISRIEHGRVDVGWSTLRRLLRALNVDLSALAAAIAEIEHQDPPSR